MLHSGCDSSSTSAGRSAEVAPDQLLVEFASPPSHTLPRVWWHWMDGNVTKEGITKDLDWMTRVGIGGIQYFDGSLETPQIVETRVPFLSDSWRTVIRHAVNEAETHNLEFTIASSPGWSETGGPWVRPEQAMKKLAWSETEIQGGQSISQLLPLPPSTSGPFQDIPGGGSEPSKVPPADLPMLYRDSRVIAYRIPTADQNREAQITSSSPLDITRLQEGGRTHFQKLEIDPEQLAWVDFGYSKPVTMRAVELVLQPGQRIGPIYPSWPRGRIEASDDGQRYWKVAELPARGAPQQTVAFPATTAQHFRLALEPRFSPFPVKAFAPPEMLITAHEIARIKFVSEARVHRFEDKAGWSTIPGLSEVQTPPADADSVVQANDVLDISDKMEADGTLRWAAPEGRWRILRMGWSLTGKQNNPASEEGTGLEVDKLNRKHVKAYMDAYLGIYEQAVGQANMGERGIRYMLNDSYEAMAANWTDDMLEEFKHRRGYSPTPWLPVLTGRIVNSAEESDRFLWDYRRTLADLIAEEHYGTISDELHARGMGRYGESHEALRAFVGDGMEVKKTADVPMGATWAMPNLPRQLPDLRESASVAHLYGQNIVAAESFTGLFPAYGFDPARLKPIADKMMANGVNRFVIHTSAHQPDDAPGPGIGLGAVGQWFTRKETWAEMARPWMEYLARSSYLLQQGRFSADIAWFYGEDDNITALYDERPPTVPKGYAFDFVNADAIRSLLFMENKNLVAPSGATYRLLAIDPNVQRITLATLRKLDALSTAGLVIAGPKPTHSPSLADDTGEFSTLTEAIWSRKGQTFLTIEAAVSSLKLEPDVKFEGEELSFVHRKLLDGDLYFIANLSDEDFDAVASFRVTEKTPEVWRADSGTVETTSYDIIDSRTNVPLTLTAHDAIFVMFRKSASATAHHMPAIKHTTLQTLTGPWQLSFPDDRGTPRTVIFDNLYSWTESESAGIRYFSGTARYSKTVSIDKISKGERLLIDLGNVANVAEVTVNGSTAGIAWKAPYQLDITELAHEGNNQIEIAVANLWPNRLIGDRQPDAKRQYAQAAYNPFDENSPLQPSGLLGPVRLLTEER
ncbi:glycosyl hydrolase [Microbulbifer sp. SH-1]|uniref:glycosyl hydrolase n=1 Tax=Microbulbifer sp. SH-1 TaxID=2681547 RepID=UPI002110B112|nr:glycosyl hydrolase [Microbulbifer sp. SH-1]